MRAVETGDCNDKRLNNQLTRFYLELIHKVFYSLIQRITSSLLPSSIPFKLAVSSQCFTIEYFRIAFEFLRCLKSVIQCLDVFDYYAIAVLLEDCVVDISFGGFAVRKVDWCDFD